MFLSLNDLSCLCVVGSVRRLCLAFNGSNVIAVVIMCSALFALIVCTGSVPF